MKRILFTLMTLFSLSSFSHAAQVTLYEDIADLGGAFGNDFKLTTFANWANQNLMFTELYTTKADADNISFLASSLSDLKILTTAEPVNGEQLITPTPSDKTKQAYTAAAVDALGGGIAHTTSVTPIDGACTWNTTDFKLRCRTGGTVYASAAMTLEANLDTTPPTASAFATDATGLEYSFTASETSTVDCTKLTATWATAGTISNFTGTASPCSSVTPVYTGDTGTMAGAAGFLTDTATNESVSFSGLAIDNSLNTAVDGADPNVVYSLLGSEVNGDPLAVGTGTVTMVGITNGTYGFVIDSGTDKISTSAEDVPQSGTIKFDYTQIGATTAYQTFYRLSNVGNTTYGNGLAFLRTASTGSLEIMVGNITLNFTAGSPFTTLTDGTRRTVEFSYDTVNKVAYIWIDGTLYSPDTQKTIGTFSLVDTALYIGAEYRSGMQSNGEIGMFTISTTVKGI